MIGTLMRLINRSGRAAAIPAATPADRQLADQMATAIAYLLKLTDEQAQPLVQAALGHRQRLRASPSAPTGSYDAAKLSLQAALERGPCLLALPFSVSGIELLRGLSADTGLELVLLESPALRTLRHEIPLATRALPACATRDAIKHVKAEVARRGRTVYVRFPELHLLGQGTTAPVSFLDKTCRFSVFDPLLCSYGLDTLLTLDGAGNALLSFDAAALRDAGQGAAMRACLHWLVGNLQLAAAAAPAATLSWHQLYRATFHCHDIERDNQLKQLDAYFAAWKRSPAGEANHAVRFASAQVAALREAHQR